MEKQRIITAAIAIPIFIVFLILGGLWLGALLTVLAVIGGWEYYKMVRMLKTRQPLMWLFCGFLYIAAGFVAFFGVCEVGAVVWLLIVIWGTDTAAYEYGRRYGRTKLAPAISPNKTVEGAIAGVIVAFVLGGGYAWLIMDIKIIPALIISILISCLGQIGDLVESRVKRLAGVKDSGNLLPGHGGVLDRFDSILLASMFMYLFLLLL